MFYVILLVFLVMYKNKTVICLLTPRKHVLINNLTFIVLKICRFIPKCLLSNVSAFITNSFCDGLCAKIFYCFCTKKHFFNFWCNVCNRCSRVLINMSKLINFLIIFAKLLKKNKKLKAGIINDSGKVSPMGYGIARVYGLDDVRLVPKHLLMCGLAEFKKNSK